AVLARRFGLALLSAARRRSPLTAACFRAPAPPRPGETGVKISARVSRGVRACSFPSRHLCEPVAPPVEQLTFNQLGIGSNPIGLTNLINNLCASPDAAAERWEASGKRQRGKRGTAAPSVHWRVTPGHVGGHGGHEAFARAHTPLRNSMGF